ncbi:hypothetical protein ACLB2K_073345 [Fragaria x ananassa]
MLCFNSELGFVCRSVLRFLDRSLARAMDFFFGCFRVRDDRHLRSRPHLVSHSSRSSGHIVESIAGVSLKCGDCGAFLRSIEEAQEHAKLTSHSNFAESTEPVLNLESDLHTKRTRHTEFADKTANATKPISLEVPKVASSESEDVATPSQTEEMVVPEVDKNMLQELEGMGFSIERATCALPISRIQIK